jgi:hypothetical protein
MVNKKYLLLAGVCSALALQPAFAQESNQKASWSGRDMTYRGQSYDALDTAYIPASRMEQQQQYLNHQYAFPSKPRNMWEFGVSLGLYNVSGDVTSKTPFTAVKPLDAMGFSAWLRKAIGYSVSWRVQYVYGKASGFDYRSRQPIEQPWAGIPTYQNNGRGIYSNYVTSTHELSLQLVGNINNIKFNRAKNSLSLYGFLGGGLMMWNTQVSVAKTDGSYYDFASAPQAADYKDRKDFNDWYKSQLKDGEYVSRGRESWWAVGDDAKGNQISPVLTGGLGVQFKLGERVSLQLEDKLSYIASDMTDGVQLYPTAGAGMTSDKDFFNYVSVGLGFNLGNKARRVLPLWWVNPMDHIYNELADPRHMNLPDPILPDSDGDGITDQFDKCPDTPSGIAVDAHGCPLDTDGDGVPDYKDKQLITPTECQPVDADGVGKCPDPECCKNMTGGACNIMAGSICFSSNSARLSNDAQNQLSTLAAQMKASPTCKVVVMGNAGNSKLQQQRSWDRVNSVIEYLSETQQISRDQFIFQYQGGTGDVNCIMYRSALPGEEGPSNVAPPHPQLGTKH